MLLAKNLQVYIKTTDTCNLNCKHCFTSGSNGKNVFFSPKNTIHFLNKLIEEQQVESMHLLYHGGEPMLAPLSDLQLFHKKALELPLKKITFGIQTNLVYNLSTEKLLFLNSALCSGIGTSWDADIRFGSLSHKTKENQLALWEKNVRTLVGNGHKISLMVCLSNYLIKNFSPEEVINYAIDLGIEYIQFERITADGNAENTKNLCPPNKKIDEWIFEMYKATIQNQSYLKIKNMFLNEIATSVLKTTHIGNRCRNCEQHIITINANGSMAGCPNSATNSTWGTTEQKVSNFLKNPNRIQAICSEKERNPICGNCTVKHICNGDCYKLKWDKEVCPAPISVLREMESNKNHDILKRLLI